MSGFFIGRVEGSRLVLGGVYVPICVRKLPAVLRKDDREDPEDAMCVYVIFPSERCLSVFGMSQLAFPSEN